MKCVRYVGVPDPRVARKARVKELLALYDEDEAAGIPHEQRRGITAANVWKENIKRLGGDQETGPTPVTAAQPYVTIRRLGPREGLSRTIRWGPKPDQFVQEISNADWEAIQRLPEADHWVLDDLTEEERADWNDGKLDWDAVRKVADPDETIARSDKQPEPPAEG